MEIQYLLFPLLYLLIVSPVMAVLPDSVYLGSVPKSQSANSYRSLANTSAVNPANVVSDLSFFRKLVTFLFVTFDIAGIPVWAGSLILALNIVMMVLPIVWLYDKIRGIP